MLHVHYRILCPLHGLSYMEVNLTKEEVIDLAEQVGLLHDGDMWFSYLKDYQDVHTDDLVRLANAIEEKLKAKK